MSEQETSTILMEGENPLIAKMKEKLGADYEIKIFGFLSSLTDMEKRLVYLVIEGNPADPHQTPDIGDFEPSDVYQKIIDGNFFATYQVLGTNITRGIGTEIKDPATGEIVKINNNNLQLGPRGQWYDSWDPVAKSIQQKVDELIRN